MNSPYLAKSAAVFRPASLMANALIILIGTVSVQPCSAASDCDVKIIKVNSVEIEDDKITINAEASIGMVIIYPKREPPNPATTKHDEGTPVDNDADDAATQSAK